VSSSNIAGKKYCKQESGTRQREKIVKGKEKSTSTCGYDTEQWGLQKRPDVKSEELLPMIAKGVEEGKTSAL